MRFVDKLAVAADGTRMIATSVLIGGGIGVAITGDATFVAVGVALLMLAAFLGIGCFILAERD